MNEIGQDDLEKFQQTCRVIFSNTAHFLTFYHETGIFKKQLNAAGDGIESRQPDLANENIPSLKVELSMDTLNRYWLGSSDGMYRSFPTHYPLDSHYPE